MDIATREVRSYGRLLMSFFIVASGIGCDAGGDNDDTCRLDKPQVFVRWGS